MSRLIGRNLGRTSANRSLASGSYDSFDIASSIASPSRVSPMLGLDFARPSGSIGLAATEPSLACTFPAVGSASTLGTNETVTTDF